MSDKIEKAQSYIQGRVVAGMIINFWEEFREVYPADVTASDLCAVGPLQAMIGLAIKNGYLALGDKAK